MCYIKPLKIEKINGDKVTLENGLVALYDTSVGHLAENDMVIVYGNVVVEKYYEPQNI